MSADKMTRNLIDILNREQKILDEYNAGCEKLHRYVIGRDWVKLEKTLAKLRESADKLNSLDLIREELILQLKEVYELSSAVSFGMLLSCMDGADQKQIRKLKQKLRLSISLLQERLKGIGNYTESRSGALRDILDTLIPDQKGKIYNSYGEASNRGSKPLLFNQSF